MRAQAWDELSCSRSQRKNFSDSTWHSQGGPRKHPGRGAMRPDIVARLRGIRQQAPLTTSGGGSFRPNRTCAASPSSNMGVRHTNNLLRLAKPPHPNNLRIALEGFSDKSAKIIHPDGEGPVGRSYDVVIEGSNSKGVYMTNLRKERQP